MFVVIKGERVNYRTPAASTRTPAETCCITWLAITIVRTICGADCVSVLLLNSRFQARLMRACALILMPLLAASKHTIVMNG